MSIGKATKLLTGIAAAAILSSCAHMPAERSEQPVAIPDAYSSATDDGAVLADDWWTTFEDRDLNRLIDEALTGNPSLRQAAARLAQAEALARKAGASQAPQVNVEGNAVRTRTRIRGIQGQSLDQTVNDFGLKLAASYEVDLWGRVGASERAAVLEADASRYDLETAVMTLVAQIADNWYALGANTEKLNLLRDQVASSRDQLRLVELRFKTGSANALDVWQQRGQLAGLEGRVPQIESAIAVGRHQLAVLLGRPPQATNDLTAASIPRLPPMPEAGVPADLLARRPDLRAAMGRVQASDERVAAAIANRLPSLRLNASAGYSSDELSRLFDDWVWNIAANILAPVIDGGSRRAEVERARAVMRERLGGYEEALLGAVKDVESALVQERKQRELLGSQSSQLDIAKQTLQQASSRYRKGLSDYLSVLRAFEEKQGLERGIVDARRQLVAYRIQLYRALGGDFSDAMQATRESSL